MDKPNESTIKFDKNAFDEINKFINELSNNTTSIKLDNAMSIENGQKLVIADCDEVLVCIVKKWVDIGMKMKIFPPYLTIKDILTRKKFRISELMIPFDVMKKYIKDPKIDTADKLALTIYRQPDFYDNLTLTKLGSSLKTLCEKKLIKLAIISHTMEENKESKEKFLKLHFPDAKLFLIPGGVKKSDIINNCNLNHYCTFIDDYLPNIYDVIINTISVGKEFIIPKYGYNDILFTHPDMTEEEIEAKEYTELDAQMIGVIDKLSCRIVYTEPL